MLYDKDSRKYKLIFSGRKQIGGCLGEEVRREELKKDMEKLLRIIDVHYLNCGGFGDVHLCQNAYCTFLICAVYSVSITF